MNGSDLNKKIDTATKAELKAEQDKIVKLLIQTFHSSHIYVKKHLKVMEIKVI